MKRLADKRLMIVLINILLLLGIIKICKITGFCLTIVNLISPLFFGYVIAWILRPLIEKLKKYNIKTVFGALIIYTIFIAILLFLIFSLVPRIVHEMKDLIPKINDFINSNKYLVKCKDYIFKERLISKYINNLNGSFKNIFSTLSTIVYSFIISFFLLVNNFKINYKLFKKIPSKLLNKISKNLRIYVKGTMLDMLVLFLLSSICFFILKLPGFLVFSFFIAVTNVIPYIGPYIGGIPAVLVGLSVSYKLGLIIFLVVIILQILESSFIQPFIMSKSLKLNPILIIIGLIIFSHFFGVIGMVVSTPLVSIIKISYDYFKKNKPDWFIKVLGKL